MSENVEFLTPVRLERLKNSVLFSGLGEAEITDFVCHAKPFFREIRENGTLRVAPDMSHMIGLVLEGVTYVYSVDYEGNKTLLKSLKTSETSGTLYSLLDYHNMLIEFFAKTDSELMFINPEAVFIADSKLSAIQHTILVNLIASQRELFMKLSEHINCLTQRTVRGKILRFLKACSERERSYNFSVPYSRDELADYLAVDRASLSRSLGELKKEGIIDFRKNEFTILTTRFFQ